MGAGSAVELSVLDRNNQLIFESLPGSLVASTLLAFTFSLATRGAHPRWVAAAWLAGGLLVSLLRYRQAWAWASTPTLEREREAAHWKGRVERAALAAGLWWALGMVILTSAATSSQRSFAGVVAAGVVSGAMMGLIAVPRAYQLFSMPILAAYLGTCLAAASSWSDWLLVVAIGTFIPVLRRGSRHVAEMMGRTVSLASQQATMLQDLKEARDAALASAHARSQFLAVMSHEIRTPLNGVVGMAGLLRETTLSPEQRDYADTIDQSAQALQLIIDDILDFSKIDAGRLELEVRDFELPTELEHLVRLMAFKATEKGLTLGLEWDPALPRHVQGDWPRLRQVLVNLLGNAIKFTASGSVRLVVQAAPGGAHRFEVHDTGVGIAPEGLARLFEPFTQADASTSRRFGGTGLGLSISRRIVQLMAGDLDVRSEPGRGSCFGFTLQLPAGVAAPAPRAAPPEEAGAPARVLLVDDNEVNLKLARTLLERVGHTVRVARDGEEALLLLGQERFDVMLLDLQMPVLDGYQTARRVREGGAAVLDARLPIVALTANATTEDREACLRAGFSDYLTKPVAPQVLRSSVARWRAASHVR